jgi:hypothetical protein
MTNQQTQKSQMKLLKLVLLQRVEIGNVNTIGDEEDDDDQITPPVEDTGEHDTNATLMED